VGVAGGGAGLSAPRRDNQQDHNDAIRFRFSRLLSALWNSGTIDFGGCTANTVVCSGMRRRKILRPTIKPRTPTPFAHDRFCRSVCMQAVDIHLVRPDREVHMHLAGLPPSFANSSSLVISEPFSVNR
jgi:hypothetical protein